MSSRARELLERARLAERLDAFDKDASQRISEAVLDKLARGESALPGIDISPVVVPKLGFLRALWQGSGLKSLVLLGAGLVSVASYAAMRVHPAHAPRHVPVVSTEVAAEPLVAPLQAQLTAEAQPPPAQTVRRSPSSSSSRAATSAARRQPTVERTRVKPEPARAQRVAVPTAEAPPPSAAAAQASERAVPSNQLDAELGLLRRAYNQLHAGKPDAAEELLDEHAQRFPHGSLEQPREVARMIVLCKMGRERAARVRADNFLALHPKSPFVPRVRSICSDSKD